MGFKQTLEQYFANFFSVVASDEGEWTVKGFIDIYKNIYTISVDTKVISKLIELMLFPVISKFAAENGYQVILSSHQNHYPDVSFVEISTGSKIALDLKSTYRITPEKVNGMTLGAFTGYFRNRDSTKNTTFPYGAYDKHYVLGIIYSRTDLYTAIRVVEEYGVTVNLTQRKKLDAYLSTPLEENFEELFAALRIDPAKRGELKERIDSCSIDEQKTYGINDLQSITSVVRDFDFFLQEKWQIAIDRPGSGNTKNIGSSTSIKELTTGSAVFTSYANGQDLFDDYWMYYMAKDMARIVDLDAPPYKNLQTYFAYKKKGQA